MSVVPIPDLSGSSVASRRIARFARSTALRTSPSWTGPTRRPTASTAIWAATSPAFAPPMPSATTSTRGLARDRSSLWWRIRPVSERCATSTRASGRSAVPSAAMGYSS